METSITNRQLDTPTVYSGVVPTRGNERLAAALDPSPDFIGLIVDEGVQSMVRTLFFRAVRSWHIPPVRLR